MLEPLILGLVCTPLFLERARTGGKCSESLTQISEARSELENCRLVYGGEKFEPMKWP